MSIPYKFPVTKDLLKRLVKGEVAWDEVLLLLRQEKDPDRFEKYIDALQELVNFDDKILVRLNEYLYVVRTKDGKRVVKCGKCGYNFGDYRVNWKINSMVRVRRTKEEMKEIYYYDEISPEPEYAEIREYYCPGCYTLLSVEVVPPGYPPLFEFLPNIDSFYRDVLKKPLEDENEEWYKDLTNEATKKFLEE